jgi:hypothetical protein
MRACVIPLSIKIWDMAINIITMPRIPKSAGDNSLAKKIRIINCIPLLAINPPKL